MVPRLVRPTETAELLKLAAHFAAPRMVKWWWEDSLRVHPSVSFALLFANPLNLVIGLQDTRTKDYLGVLVFNHVVPGWRATMHCAVWDPKVSRRPDLLREVGAGVFLLMGLHTVDAITSVRNRAARLALKRAGFVKRATFPGALSFDGERVDAEWWEITRGILGLPAPTASKEVPRG